ncbi:MAG TPA: DmsE family decaheme c-type cytochrome [Acetobacteraceae bacterium]|jgi:DmsE family decaheme c-type cytochrome
MKRLLALTLLLAMALMLESLPAAAQQPASASPQAAVAAADVRTCLTCHGGDPKVQAILHSPMAAMGDPRTPFAQGGCEGCHGPSLDHAQGKAPYPAVVFEGPHASPVAVRNEMCLGCHQGSERMNWQGSVHQRNDVACTTCHTAHSARDPMLVKIDQPEKCFTCHNDIRAATYKYSHHPIREGKVVCSDCHNPHGSPGNDHLLKEFTVNETCYTCHADKRGPMLWEHQPVREDCMNCHDPHGSNEQDLIKTRLQFLCSTCHSAETANHSGGAFGGMRSIPGSPIGNPSINSALANQRVCLNCHSQVHGSNSPAGAYFFR